MIIFVGIGLITVIFSLQGKVFPKLRKRVPQGSGSSDSVSDKEEDEATDYVFRILFPNSQSEFGERLLPPKRRINMTIVAFFKIFMKMSLVVCYSDCNPSSPPDFLPLPSTEWTVSLQNRDPGCPQEILQLSWRIPLIHRKQL